MFGYTDLARRTLAKDHPAHEALGMIEQSARQASGVTKSLLTFTRRSQTEKTAVNLGVVLGEAVRLLRPVLPATIEIITEITPASPVWVLADATQLHQILMNLAINSRDAMPDGGILRVILAEPDGDAGRPAAADESTVTRSSTFTVEDTGVGMPDEVRLELACSFFWSIMFAIGFPTILLLPITTTCFPFVSILYLINNS